MDAKEYLESYAALKMEVRNLEDRIAEVFYAAQLPAMRQSDGSQKTPSRDVQEKANIRYIETKDEMQPLIDANKEKMRQISGLVATLSNPFHREILRIRYMDTNCWKPLKWADVAMQLRGNDEERDVLYAKRLHKKAMEEFASVYAEFCRA